MLSINGSAMPSPGAMQVAIEDVSGAVERTASGSAVRDFVGTRRRLKLRWGGLSAKALAVLLRAVDGGFFEASFPDPVSGRQAEATCWCAARSMGVLRVQDGEPVWTDVEMEWIER